MKQLPAFASPLLAAFFLPASPALAQNWQSLSGQISGTPAGIGPQPAADGTWFAGTVTGDYRSTDNGATWSNISSTLLDDFNRIITANYYFKSSTGRLFRMGDTATWSNRVASPMWYSDNNGTTWTEVPLPFATPAAGSGIIGFTAMTEHGGALYVSDQLSHGVWKSSDNGLTWAAARNGLPLTLTWPYQISVFSSITSTPAGVFATSAAAGIYRSTDGGANWTAANTGLPSTSISARDIVTLSDGTLFAIVSDNSIYRSTDGGASWQSVTQSLGEGSPRSLATDGTRLYAYTSNKVLLESPDKGLSFSKVNAGSAPNMRGSNHRQLSMQGNILIYSSDTAFHRLDVSTAPRAPITPAVTTPPVGKGVNVGSTLTLNVGHSNATLPITYQWKRDGVPVGTNSATLTLSSATIGDAGNYTVDITNSGGTVTSAAANVRVEPNTAGYIDYTIQPMTLGNQVLAAAYSPDGSVWVGGQFSPPLFDTVGRRVLRLLPDGTRDNSFVPTTTVINSENILALLPLPDGSVLAGGGESGTGSQYLRKLMPDGSIDSSFDWPNELTGSTYSIIPGPGDTSYVAGAYGVYRIFNHNGNIDFTFNPPVLTSAARAMAVAADGKLLIVGNFTTVNGVTRGRIARLMPDGTLDLTFTPDSGFNAELNGVAVQKDGSIVVIGSFTSYRGTNIARVARILDNANIDPGFTPPTFVTGNNGRVYAFTLDGQDRIVLGGQFTQVNGTTRNNIARLNTNGTLDESFPGRPDALPIQFLAAQPDGNLLAGTNQQFYRLLGSGQAYPTISGFTQDLSAQPGSTATFTVSLTGPTSGAVYEWFRNGTPISGASGPSLAISPVSATDAAFYKVRVTIGSTILESRSSRLNLLGAPYFFQQPEPGTGYHAYRHHLSTRAGGTGPITYQWYKNGSPVSGATGTGLFFPALTAADAGSYVLRATNSAGTAETTPHQLNVLPRHGTVDPSFNFVFTPKASTVNEYQSIIQLPNGYFLLGGSFNSDATGARSLLRLFPDGSIDPSFDSAPLAITGSVRWLFRQSNGKIIIGSDVRPIRLNADLTPDSSFTFPNIGSNYAISTMILLSSDKLLVQGSSSSSVPGYTSKLFRTTVDGVIDTTFPAVALTPTASVTALHEDANQRLVLAGGFTNVAGQTRNRLARLSDAGVLDATFTGPGAITGVPVISVVTTAPDGSVFIGGNGITLINNTPAGRIAKFNKDTGAHDPTFFPSSSGTSVYDIHFLPDGRISTSGNTNIDTLGTKAVFETYHPNGARDRRGLGETTGGSSAFGAAIAMAPSLPGTHILPGTFSSQNTPRSYAVRFFTADVPLAFVQDPVTSTATTPANTVNLNSNVTLSSIALGTGNVQYQWYFNGNAISGATSATLARNSVQRTHEGTYTVTATNSTGTVTSRPMYLDVLAEPEIITQPTVVYNSGGSTATLTATVKGMPNITYTWRKDGVTVANVSSKITGATTLTLNVLNLAEIDSGAYQLVATNSIGTTISRPADVVVTASVGSIDTSWSTTPPSVNSAVEVHPARLLPGPDGGFYIGASYFGFSGVSGTQRYAARMDATGNRVTTFTHNSVSPLESMVTIRWATHPSGILYAAASTSGGGTTYLYRFNNDGSAVGSGSLQGTASDIAFDSEGRLILATASISTGNVRRYTVDTTANTATLDPLFTQLNTGSIFGLYPSPATGGWYVAGPNITTASNTGLGNAHSTLFVVRFGADGVVDNTFSTSTNMSGFSYRPFLLERPDGKVHFRNIRFTSTGSKETTGWLDTTIPQDATRGYLQPDGKLVVAGPNTVRRVQADGVLDASFTAPVVAGNITDILPMPSGHLYAIGNFNATAATNNRVDLIRLNLESPDLAFTAPPVNLTVDEGQSATFSATVSGTGVTYKWYHNGVLLSNGGRYSGAGTSSLTIANVNGGDQGSLRLEISNTAGVRSRTAFLTVNPPPAGSFSSWDALLNAPVGQRGPLDKPDGDGIPNLIKFALGLDVGTPAGSATTISTTIVSGTAYPSIVFNRRKNIGDVEIQVLASSTLPMIDSIPTQVVSVTDNGDGTETVVVRTNVPISASGKQFLSVQVTLP